MSENKTGLTIETFKEDVDLRDHWTVEADQRTLTFTYEAVPQSRLQRSSRPGVDVNFIRGAWMLASDDRIASGFDRDHQGILARGTSIHCQHRDDAVAALEHATERVEESVGEELRDGHAKPRVLMDGGEEQSWDASKFEYDPIWCQDCEELVVVTRNPDAETHDERVKFECGCSVGSIGAVKPDSWTGGEFL